MAPLTSPEMHESDRKPNWNVMRTFDLTLHFDDETLGHDETGCYLCLLGCRKPLYQAGQVVAGHMVIRPVRNIHISGVSVIFSGRYVTKWREDQTTWGNYSLFYEEVVYVVEKRQMELDGQRYYRYDFEYRLPVDLPSSLKCADGKLAYCAQGVVHAQTGSDIYTNARRFRVWATVDTGRLPSSLRDPVERAEEQVCKSWLTGDDRVRVKLMLNVQTLVPGEPLVATATVDNLTSRAVGYSIALQQVMAFSAILGCENRGKHSTPLYHRRRHRKQTTKDLASSGVVAVTPHTAVTARRIFSIPRALLPSSQSHISVPHPLRQHGDIISPEIYVSYVVKLSVSSESSGSELSIPIEVDIGTTDSRSQQHKTDDAASTIETECSLYSHSLYSHSGII
ncbi:hypothetical protein NP493_588g01070 [Ridgeia piscesae]|uniref:Arrestin C-terminal-like domain-containing protein n=1 Tax=Ridgeia piscesae TaxID=27915 RepID=A0AAD9NP58_RIDPI|nr:hypothetical protein NP493_588g01070 [Ridgeia piscesae]